MESVGSCCWLSGCGHVIVVPTEAVVPRSWVTVMNSGINQKTTIDIETASFGVGRVGEERFLIQVKLQLRIDQRRKKAVGIDGVASESRKCENRWREMLLCHDEPCCFSTQKEIGT